MVEQEAWQKDPEIMQGIKEGWIYEENIVGSKAHQKANAWRNEPDIQEGIKEGFIKEENIVGSSAYLRKQREPKQEQQSQRPTKATWGDRAKEFGQGYAQGAGQLVDTAAAGGNALLGGVTKAVGATAGAMGFDNVASSYNETSDRAMNDAGDLWKNKHLEKSLPESEMLHTSNAEDSISKALKAGGNLASQAPLFKGISTAAKGLNVLVNGKTVTSPIINKVSKFLSTEQGVGALSVEFAGAGAAGEALKREKAGGVENAVRELAGNIIGGGAINYTSRVGLSIAEEPIKLVGNLIDLSKEITLKEGSLALKEGSKSILNKASENVKNIKNDMELLITSPMAKLYQCITTGCFNSKVKIDKESIANLKRINSELKPLGIEVKPDVFNSTSESSAAYSLAKWLPDESIKKMYRKNMEAANTYITHALETGHGKIDKHLDNFNATPNDKTDLTSSMNYIQGEMEDNITEHIGNLKHIKNSIYKKRDAAITNTDKVDTSTLVYEIDDMLKNSFKAPVPSPDEEKIITELTKLKNKFSAEKEMAADSFVSQMRSTNAAAHKEKSLLNNYSHHLKNVLPKMEAALLKSASDGKTIKRGDEIIKLTKEADKFHSEEYVPIMQTELIKSITEGKRIDKIFSRMDSLEGIKEVEKVLMSVDDYAIRRHSKKVTDIRETPIKKFEDKTVNKMVFEAADANRNFRADELAKNKPVSLRDTVFALKSQQLINESIYQRGEFHPDKFLNLFNDSMSQNVLKATLGEPVYKKLKDNAKPLIKKLLDIGKMDANHGGGVTGSSNNNLLLDKVTTGAAYVGASALAGGINPTGVAVGAGVMLAKWQLAKAFAKASSNPRIMNALLRTSESTDNKQFLTVLERVYNMDIIKYKALGLSVEGLEWGYNEADEALKNEDPKQKEFRHRPDEGDTFMKPW